MKAVTVAGMPPHHWVVLMDLRGAVCVAAATSEEAGVVIALITATAVECLFGSRTALRGRIEHALGGRTRRLKVRTVIAMPIAKKEVAGIRVIFPRLCNATLLEIFSRFFEHVSRNRFVVPVLFFGCVFQEF